MAMNKDYWRIRLESAIRNTNDAFPGSMSWSDVRWEIERARSKKSAEALASIVEGVPLADLALMHAVALEEATQLIAAPPPATSNSTADYVDVETVKVQDAPPPTKFTKKRKAKGKR